MKLTPKKEYYLSMDLGRYNDSTGDVYDKLKNILDEYADGIMNLYGMSDKHPIRMDILDMVVKEEISTRDLVTKFTEYDPFNIRIYVDDKEYLLKEELNTINSGYKKSKKKIKRSFLKNDED